MFYSYTEIRLFFNYFKIKNHAYFSTTFHKNAPNTRRCPVAFYEKRIKKKHAYVITTSRVTFVDVSVI